MASTRFCLSVFAFTLLGCGRLQPQHTTPKPGSAQGGGEAGGATSTAGASAGGAPVSVGGAPAVDVNCLYPRSGFVFGPDGLGDAARREYTLSEGHRVEVEHDWQTLAAAYDVNGDGISDLLYESNDVGEGPRLHLALTQPPPNVFEFQEADCAELDQLPVGRVFLRDLNDDQVPDFVIGTTLGLKAFLNLEHGLKQVLDYTSPAPTVSISWLTLNVTDLDGNGRIDLVAGFDRLQDQLTPTFATGAMAFTQGGSGQFDAGEAHETHFGGGSLEGDYVISGYLAAGRFGNGKQGSGLLGGASSFDSTIPLGLQTSFQGELPKTVRVPDLPDNPRQFFAVPTRDGKQLLLVTGNTKLMLLDLSQEPPELLQESALAYHGGLGHELGGGNELTRYFLYDVDRDGDADFLEQDLESGSQLALHLNRGDQSFDAPIALPARLRSGAESPFLQVGPGVALLDRPGFEGPHEIRTLLAGPK